MRFLRFFKGCGSILSIMITAVFLMCSMIFLVSADPGNSDGQIKLHTTLEHNAVITIEIDVLDSTVPAGYTTITRTFSRDNNGNYYNWNATLGNIGEGIKTMLGNNEVSNSEVINNGNIVSFEKLNLCVRVYIDGQLAQITKSDFGNGNGNKSVWNIWVDIPTEASTTTTESSTTTTESSAATTESSAATTESSAATTESSTATTESSAATTESSAATTESSTATTESSTATTGSSTTTTGSSTATTGSSTTTTESSAETTESSAETTESSATTTGSSATTTGSSTTTTESSAETTESSATTTESSATTTGSSTTTTESSAETTESSATTTESSATTTETSTTASDPELISLGDEEVPLAGPEPSDSDLEENPDALIPLSSPPNTGVSTGLAFLALSTALCGVFILFVFRKKAKV